MEGRGRLGQNGQVVMRRWDGRMKQASVWYPAKKDPDLFDINGDCLIYLSRPSQERKQYSFVIPVHRLIAAKCPPLFAQMATNDTSSDSKSRWQHSKKSNTYTLCLEAPDRFSTEAALIYHVTTRNFFAWIMSKPIVGRDPASALLSLKLRMDAWRAPTVNNLSDLYHYAKTQGYGDLGDMSLLLTSRLKGMLIKPDEYKMIDEKTDGSAVFEATETPKNSNYIRKRLQSLQIRFYPSMATAHQAIPVHCGDPNDANENNRRSTSRPRSLVQKPYSLPVLPSSSIEDVSHEMETRWIDCVTQAPDKHTETGSDISLPARSIREATEQNIITPSSEPPKSSSLLLTRRRGASLSRPPSPIAEETIDDAPPAVPQKSPRRYSLPATDFGQVHVPASSRPSILPPRATQGIAATKPLPNFSTTSKPQTIDYIPPLPLSHTVTNSSASKPLQPAKNVRHSLDGPSRQKRGKSRVDPDTIYSNPAYKKGKDKAWHLEEVTKYASQARELVFTRFPSLRRLGSAPTNAESTNNTTQKRHARNHAAHIFQNSNISEPNIRSPSVVNERGRTRLARGISSATNTSAQSTPSNKPITIRRPYTSDSTRSAPIPDFSLKQTKQLRGTSTDKFVTRDLDPSAHNAREQSYESHQHTPLESNIIDSYDLPLGREQVYSCDTSVIDNILDDIAISVHNEPGIYSSVLETPRHIESEQFRLGKIQASNAIPSSRKNGNVGPNSLTKNKIRKSLRLWNYKKKLMDDSPPQNNQGNVLIMDYSGKFSTIASSRNETEGQRYQTVDDRKQHRKLFYELP